MCMRSIPSLDRAVQTANLWLTDLAQDSEVGDETRAYSILRVVLHALRDGLGVVEAANFSAQLPTVLRGMFFEGWRPSHVPRPATAFGLEVERGLRGMYPPSPERATRLVYELLTRRIAEGEIRTIRHAFPAELFESQGAW